MNNYTEYDKWKGWGVSTFGTFSIQEKNYYRKLFKLFDSKNIRNVLEIGFGNGSFMGYLKELNISVDGIEIIDSLKDFALNSGFDVYGDLQEIPCDKKYDAIFMFDVLEHISQDKIVDFLVMCEKFLNRNGYMVFRTPNGASPLGLANQYGDITHCTVLTSAKMAYILKFVPNIKIIYSGWDVYPIFNGRFSKVFSRIINRSIQLITEKFIRLVFAPQSVGILSANLLVVAKSTKN